MYPSLQGEGVQLEFATDCKRSPSPSAMAFDLNNPPGYFQDEDITYGEGGPWMRDGHGLLDLNMLPVQDPEDGPEKDPGPHLHRKMSSGSGDEFVELDGILDLTTEAPGRLDLNVKPEPEINISTVGAAQHDNFGSGIPQSNNNRRRKKMLTDGDRDAVYKALLTSSTNGKLGKKNTTIVAQNLGVKLRTVQRIWQQAKKQQREGLDVDVSHNKTKRVGRKKCAIDLSRVPSIALRKRTTLRSLAGELRCSVTTLHRRLKMGMLRHHSSTVKPFPKDEN